MRNPFATIALIGMVLVVVIGFVLAMTLPPPFGVMVGLLVLAAVRKWRNW